MRFIAIFPAALMAMSCVAPDSRDPSLAHETAPAVKSSSAWSTSSVVEASDSSVPGDAKSYVVTESGDSVTVPLTQVHVLSAIPSKSGVTWLALSGIECTHCDAPEIVVFVPVNERVAKAPLHAYSYPGDQIEPGVGPETPHYRSRMFLGSCLESTVAGLILEETADSVGAWVKSARIIRLDPAFGDSIIAWHDSLEQAAANSDGKCREVSGKTQYVF